MKKKIIALGLFLSSMFASAQHVEFEEYKLPNGLHVILQQDKSAPVVTTSVMYHVGAKDEQPNRTGFAHFFEHLLFEGTQNVGRGQWFKIVAANGGQNNANTSDDRTYYYETFPSNNLQLGLWLESERMLHPVINQIGVDTQRDVIKEEKRLRIDNVPYGQLLKAVKENIFKNHPYRWTTIGEMEHLDAATLDEFKAFFKKFYVPNNAVLVVAGDFDKAQTKKWIEDYFATIPEGQAVNKAKYQEEPITKQINATFEDKNVQLPMLVNAFRIPSFKDRDAYVLDFISSILSKGKSSRLYNRLVDQEKSTLEVGSFAYTQEDYGTYFIYALPMPGKTVQDLQASIDEELKKISSGLITDDEYQKTLNSIETDFVNQNSTSEGIAENLATNYLLRGNTNLINTEIDIYRSITREEIQNVAQKYLQPNQRLVLEYTGEKK
jgi:predicted Zn-dependent peptidase